MMDPGRLAYLLDRFPDTHVLVAGDFFLDRYLAIDRRLSEVSLETGLEAYQVVEVRCSPGAAGTVTSNLRALDVQVTGLGVIGDDGEGYELRRALLAIGTHIEPLIERPDRFTPTYTKPLLREVTGREHELQRLDIKNRVRVPPDVEDQVITHLKELVPQVSGVIVADQVPEYNCGVITDRIREEIGRLAVRYPEVIFAADSRERIGLFRQVIVKPNAREVTLAVHREWSGDVDLAVVRRCGSELQRRNGRPVFVTLGDQGILVFTEKGAEHVPAVTISGEIDVVGAGDSAMAGIVSALCSGAEPAEAALVGNLVASITIQQIGTTGTASRAEVLEQLRSWRRAAKAATTDTSCSRRTKVRRQPWEPLPS